MTRKTILLTAATVLIAIAPMTGIGADRVVLGEYFTQLG